MLFQNRNSEYDQKRKMKALSDLKKLYLKESKSKIIKQEKGRTLSTVITVRLEEDGERVVVWLASDLSDSFEFFVFIQVEAMNRQIFPFEVINGSAVVNSRSITCALKNKNYFFLIYVSNLRKFADSVPLILFEFPNSSLDNTSISTIDSAEQQHCSIFQSNKAVARNFPEKVKIFKNN